MSNVQDRIRETITNNPIILYVKGSKQFPQCGFSAAVIEIFKTLGVPFETVDVLSDPEIRDGIKQFTSWPTIPQIFVKGEFIGGCDIVTELYQNGELQKMIEKAGITK